jgi:tripartite-type tricarboxylate transporter receptor subunit TctC
MNIHRRCFLQLATSATAACIASPAFAQAYPSKPVRIVVGFAPGGGQDILARLIAGWLSERLGQQVLIETKPGQAGSLGAETVVRSPPDGYTLYLIGPNNAINHTLYDNLSFDIVKDLTHVAALVTMPNVMAVHPSVPVNTVREFIDYAKANPGKVNFASGGVGTSVHVSGELFKQMTGVQMQHVPYRGAADRPYQAGQAARARRHVGYTLAGPAGPADRGRYRSGFRGHRILRRERAAQHPGRRAGHAEPRDQCRTARFQAQGAVRRPRR